MERVAYKPLNISPVGDPELDGDDAIDILHTPFQRLTYHKSQSKLSPSNYTSRFGLRQLRILLYMVAVIVFLIFIAQFSTNANRDEAKFEAQAEHNTSSFLSTDPLSDPTPMKLTVNSNIRPQYESYLASVLLSKNSPAKASVVENLDDLLLPVEDQPSAKTAVWWILNLRDREKYVTVTNYIRAMKSFSYNFSVTLTTQATTEFMYHTLELCKRWDGPISVAVFGPGTELQVATTLIRFMRQCLPGPLSACIRDKVTWHLVYNKSHGPSPSAITYPKHHLDSINYPLFVNQNQCPKFAGPEPEDLIKQFQEDLSKKNGLFPLNYRQQLRLTYPINVLRNTARLAANTRYLLASDIELYPSINLVPWFTNFINKHDIQKELNVTKFAFTLPIFEVKSDVSTPSTKQELIKLFLKEEAIFFHKWVCDVCQNFPNRIDWLQTDVHGYEDYTATNDEISVFEVTQRDKTRSSWEPIFIGTNDDPLYDDRLTWDGRRDKMGQMFEMCLQDYYLIVIGNAFLVHAPGIKHIDKNDNMKRLSYMRENNAFFDETISELRRQYANSSNIDKC